MMILLLPILLPFLAGAGVILLPFGSRRARNRWTWISVFATSLAIAGIMIWMPPGGTLTTVCLAPEISIAFRADGLGRVFLALIAFLWPVATLYAFEYMDGEEHQGRFFACYTACYGITAGVALSANLLTMYLFVELLTLVTVPLVAHEGDRKSMRAARKYMIYSFSGATLSLVGMMILISRSGTTDFISGGIAGCDNGDGLLTAAWFLTFLGFGVKAAAVPLHAWLPSAGVAPTPVTALLHAVAVVKSGVFAVIRSTYYVFGTAMLAGSWGQKAGLAVASLTILYGSVTAFREQHIKRRLAYSTISNLSYILFGAMLMTDEGLAASLSHMLFHGVIKITLFFCAGALIRRAQANYVSQMTGIGRKMPRTTAAFTIGALALTGMPLLPGFISKINLIRAAADSDCGAYGIAGIAALLLSALLTAGYLILPSIRAWIGNGEAEAALAGRESDPSWRMQCALAVLCAAMLALGVCAVPVLDALNSMIAAGV